MPEGIEHEPENAHTYVGPPALFGLQWSTSRIVYTRRGERSLSKADATPELHAAWVRIPTKPAGDSDLKPAVILRRSRPPVRSEAGQ